MTLKVSTLQEFMSFQINNLLKNTNEQYPHNVKDGGSSFLQVLKHIIYEVKFTG